MPEAKPCASEPLLEVLPLRPMRLGRRRETPGWLPLALVLGVLLLCGGGVGSLVVLGVLWAANQSVPDAPGYKDKDDAIKMTKSSFNSGGKTIEVERFEPVKEGKYPAVLVVHGADGLQYEPWRKVYRGHAQELARHGYVALIVHYFDRTGSKVGDAKTNKEHFVTWMGTLGEAIAYTAGLPNVDGKRIGLLGVSLGSYLSLSLAAFDPRVGAVVEVFGGMPPQVAGTLKKMPPTLILHGDADKLVPVAEARKLETVLKDKEIPYEIKIYPGQGHGFTGAAAKDALQRGRAFFDKHLKKDKDEAPAK